MSVADRYIIEDTGHAEWIGEHATLEQAWRDIERLSRLPWDQPPNQAPCTGWRTCERTYEIIEFDTSVEPWTEIRRLSALTVSAQGTIWGSDAPGAGG